MKKISILLGVFFLILSTTTFGQFCIGSEIEYKSHRSTYRYLTINRYNVDTGCYYTTCRRTVLQRGSKTCTACSCWFDE